MSLVKFIVYSIFILLMIFRLVFYDRNDNFGRADDVNPRDEFAMITPPATQYKDINSQTKVIPKLELHL